MKSIKPINVLIVDDSILFRQTLQNQLNKDPYINIIGTAIDSYDAIEKIKELNPDVVTLDLEMPKMNGLELLKRILPTQALPIVVVSAQPSKALDALDAGAVDFVSKPLLNSPSSLNSFINELSTKIKIASIARIAKAPMPNTNSIDKLKTHYNNDMIIAIGASTGGTEAILEVIKDLPATTPGILIVQHMPPVFTKMYADRLNKICQMNVKEAENGDRITKGQVIIAAGAYHLRLAQDTKGYYVKSEMGAKVSNHCPSVDVLFESVAAIAGKNAIGVILTGMGSDGAKGILKMRQKQAYTIGQDKESSIVYGMPMVAYNIGGIEKQLPLNRIGNEIIKHLNNII